MVGVPFIQYTLPALSCCKKEKMVGNIANNRDILYVLILKGKEAGSKHMRQICSSNTVCANPITCVGCFMLASSGGR